MSMSHKYYCFPAVAASATATTEVINKGGYLQFTGASLTAAPASLKNFPIPLLGIKNGFYKAYAAEVLRVITVTPTAANSTDYRLILSAEKGQTFDNNLPNETQTVFTHTTAASGATATTIADAFRTAINNHPFWSTRVVASGTTTLIITAKAGFPIFSVGAGPLLSAAVTTAGSPQYGATGAQLLASNNFNSTLGLPVAGTNYGVYVFEGYSTSEAVMSGHGDVEKNFIYLVDGGNNANLIAALTALLVK